MPPDCEAAAAAAPDADTDDDDAGGGGGGLLPSNAAITFSADRPSLTFSDGLSAGFSFSTLSLSVLGESLLSATQKLFLRQVPC